MEKGGRSKCSNRWSLAGMTALVTGGSKGIGHAIVEELAELGAAVHTCSRNEEELNKCLEKWREMKFNVTGSVCDVSCRSQREELMERVNSNFQGKLNILINNAGTGFPKAAVDISADQYSYLMATNLESAFHLSQLAHPLLKASGRGSIVFISSIAGLVAITNISIYSATKGALNQLAKNLACEWAKDNIRANSIAPGAISTPLMKPVLDIEAAKAREVSQFAPWGFERSVPNPHGANWGGRGGFVPCGLPLHARGIVHHRPSHLRRRRSGGFRFLREMDGFAMQIIFFYNSLFFLSILFSLFRWMFLLW